MDTSDDMEMNAPMSSGMDNTRSMNYSSSRSMDYSNSPRNMSGTRSVNRSLELRAPAQRADVDRARMNMDSDSSYEAYDADYGFDNDNLFETGKVSGGASYSGY